MNFVNVVYEAVEILGLIIPFIFLGFFIANLVKQSPYLKHIGKPMSYLASASNLPARCSPALTMFFVNSYTGRGALSDLKQDRSLSDKEVVVAMLVGQLPKGFHTAIFYMAPVAFSVLGLFLGGILLSLELLMCIAITIIGVITGKLFLNSVNSNFGVENNFSTLDCSNKKWKKKLKEAMKKSFSQSKEIVMVVVPTVLAVLILLNLGLQESLVEISKPLLRITNLPSSSVMVLAASIPSQIAAISAAGTLISKNFITPLQSLLLLLIARALHLGIGCFKIGLPTNIALFGNSLGLKVTLAVYSLIELSTFTLVISMIHFI